MKAERGDEQRINKNWLNFHEKKLFSKLQTIYLLYTGLFGPW